MFPPMGYHYGMARRCTFPDCGRISRYADRLCNQHHRDRLRGVPLKPIATRRPPVPNDGGPCHFAGCTNVRVTGGLCSGHYAQLIKGRTLAPLIGSSGYSERRFWEQVARTDDCWLWIGGAVNSGYGRTTIDGVKWLVHRYAYVVEYGDIPAGLVIDHTCRNKLCIRPDHLRAVSHVTNVRAQGLRTNNTSGVRGVSWDKARGKWVARVNVSGRKHHLGRFATLEEAAQAVASARARFYETDRAT